MDMLGTSTASLAPSSVEFVDYPNRSLAGDSCAAAQAVSQHPVEAIQKQCQTSDFERKCKMMRHLNGAGAEIHLRMENSLLKQLGNPPLSTEAGLGDEIMSGRIDSIDFQDVLDDPQFQPAMALRSVHQEMEKRMGL